MGNYNSCAFLSPKVKTPKASRVILPNGEIRHFREQTKAAELMLEYPAAFFVTDSRSLHIGRRFSPLAADEDLEFGHVYVMFPMRRANSFVTAADVAVFFMGGNSSGRRIAAGRVTPDSGEAPAAESVGVGRFPAELEVARRLSVCRSKKPVLDTIVEEPLRSR